MLNKVKQQISRFDDLPLRLRLMITFAAIFILFAIVDISWLSGTNGEISSKERELLRVNKLTEEFLDTQNKYNEGVYNDRNNPKLSQLNKLDQKLKEVRNSLKSHTLNLVQPEDMADLLNKIIQSTDALELQSLTKQKAIPLSNSETSEVKNENSVELYRHTLELNLIGNYHATFLFLQKLENMEKKMAFDNFEYVVEEYPSAQIKLVVSTLSLQEEWIGG